MANTKLMREALEAISEFWREGMVALDPYALISDGDEIISALVNRALNTDSDASSDQNDGDVHLTSHQTTATHLGDVECNPAETWVEFDIRSLKGENWCDNYSHPVKHATCPTGKGCNFRARPDDADEIILAMKASGLEVRDYR